MMLTDQSRIFFPDSNYVGVDLTEGPGVDLVCSGDEVSHPDNTYDICISCECFEHNPNWVSTFRNMYRMTKNGGLVIMTCATTDRAEHGTTRTEPKHSPGTQSINWDYYKNLTSDDFIENFNISEMFKSHFLWSIFIRMIFILSDTKPEMKMIFLPPA